MNDELPHSTLAERFSGGPHRFHPYPAPLLGQRNHELLTGLGLIKAEIADLEAVGVIGPAPGFATTTRAR